MLPSFETDRLILRPMRRDDAKAVQQHFAHWEIVKHMAAIVPWPYPADGAVQFLESAVLPDLASGAAGHWALTLKERKDDALIGSITLRINDDKETHRGFWLGQPWQRCGLMTEAANAVTDYWFNTLQRPFMRIYNAVDNAASGNIKRHAGFKLVHTGERNFVCGRLEAETWEITREAWQARRPHRPRLLSVN